MPDGGANDPMVDPSLSAPFKAFRPLAKSAIRKAARLHAERRAGTAPWNVNVDFMEGSFRETLSRLCGGRLDDSWWRHLLTSVGARYVAPAVLQKPVVQDWLSSREVQGRLKAIAKGRVMGVVLDGEDTIREQLSDSYSEATGEAAHLAEGPVDAVAAILAAGYAADIPTDQRAVAGMVQNVGQAVAGVDRKLGDALAHPQDPTVERVHSQLATRELETILIRRTFNFNAATDAVRILCQRVADDGELGAAADTVKRAIRYWAARLCAVSPKTLDFAKELRSALHPNDTAEPLVVVDAWIAATGGDLDKAIRLLRGEDDPDARAALLTLLVRDGRDIEGLEWFADADPATVPGYFNDHGWKVWAVSLVKLGRWEQAARGLRALGAGPDWSASLAATEGMVNAALLLPADEELRQFVLAGVPMHQGIKPRLDPAAVTHHERAAACFEYVDSQLAPLEDENLTKFIASWRRWVGLMDPDQARREVAEADLRSRMNDGDADIGLLDFALAFGISFDVDAFRARLRQYERFGGLNDEQVRAECLLNRATMAPGEFATYVEDRRERVEGVMDGQWTTVALFDALVADRQFHRAAATMPAPGDVDDAVRTRMQAALDLHQGANVGGDLRAAYERTGRLVDLHNLIGQLELVDDHVGAFPYIQTLFDRDPTLPNARRVISSLGLRTPADHRAILTFLDKHPQFVEQSHDVKGAKAWALFHEGRLDQARQFADILLSQRHGQDDLALDVNIAVAQGDWDRLPAIVHREWPQRHNLRATALMTLARLASQTLPDRAIELAKLAAEKEPDDPRVLTEAHALHFELGHDAEADPSWLARALEQSSETEGPIWRTDLEQIVTEVLPRQQEQRGKIERMLMQGELPLILAAGMSNTPLSRVLLEPSSGTQDPLDARRRAVLPIISGARGPVPLQQEWTVGLDVTSVMVLARLGLLDAVIESCGHIKVAPEVMESLYVETFAVRFHQPARVAASKRLRSLLDHGRLVAFESGPVALAEQDELGPELAALLSASRHDDGVAICARPIHKAQSLMEVVADTSAYDDLIFTPADLCMAARAEGLVEDDAFERTMDFLASQGQKPEKDLPPSRLRGPIVLDRLALSYLENAQMLDVLAAKLDVRVHRNVVEDATALIEAGDTGQDFVDKIEATRAALCRGVEATNVSFLPRARGAGDKVLDGRPSIRSVEALVAGCTECDAICVDDRYMNNHREATAPSGESVPVVCVLDLLRYLRTRGAIDDADHRRAKHRLRRGGFAWIPVEASELLNWLQAASVGDKVLVETAELKVLRQSLNWLDAQGLLQPHETQNFVGSLVVACMEAIRTAWMDATTPTARAEALCDWIWRYLLATMLLPQAASTGGAPDVRCDVLASRLSLLFLPLVTDSEERRSAYGQWLERAVVDRFRPANVDLVEEALHKSLTMVRQSVQQGADLTGPLFFACLPESLRSDAVSADREFARRCGFESGMAVGIGGGVAVPEDDLFRVAESVLSGAGAATIKSRSGTELTVRLEDGLPSKRLEVQWCDNTGQPGSATILELTLFSPDGVTRSQAFEGIIKRFGPTT